MPELTAIQVGHVRRYLDAFCDFVPTPMPVGGPDVERDWSQRICGVIDHREVAKLWASRAKELGKAIVAIGCAESMRVRQPNLPPMGVVFARTIDDHAKGILVRTIDSAEGEW